MKVCNRCGAFYDGDLQFCPTDGQPLSELPGQPDGQDPLIGQVLDGRYRVLSLIGKGGMATVYRGVQVSTNREVALKVVREKTTQEGHLRFLREARAISELRNVHTVTLFDSGRTKEGVLYMAMELLEGQTLAERLSRQGALPWQKALHIIAQIAESLAEAHEKHIVHRDLKPGNVFLVSMSDDPDFVKVLDFGIAKLRRSGLVTSITGQGQVLGTPRYMAPEQARGVQVDERADLYALGIVLYEMIAGRAPFEARRPVALMIMHCNDPVPRPQRFNPGLRFPSELKELLDGLLEKDPEARIATAAMVRDQALAILQLPETSTDPARSMVDEHAALAHAQPRSDSPAISVQLTTPRSAPTVLPPAPEDDDQTLRQSSLGEEPSWQEWTPPTTRIPGLAFPISPEPSDATGSEGCSSEERSTLPLASTAALPALPRADFLPLGREKPARERSKEHPPVERISAARPERGPSGELRCSPTKKALLHSAAQRDPGEAGKPEATPVLETRELLEAFRGPGRRRTWLMISGLVALVLGGIIILIVRSCDPVPIVRPTPSRPSASPGPGTSDLDLPGSGATPSETRLRAEAATRPGELPAASMVVLHARPGSAEVFDCDGRSLGHTPLGLPTPSIPTELTLERRGFLPTHHILRPGSTGPVTVELRLRPKSRRSTRAAHPPPPARPAARERSEDEIGQETDDLMEY